MTDFEFLFALFGLLFGLIVAELALKFADAIDYHRERAIGILTPALAFLLLTDVTSFWLIIWSARRLLTVSWTAVFSGVLIAIVYFVAAALVFPRASVRWTHLDDHYWTRKRFVAGAMLLANLAADAALMREATPAWNDWWFYYWFVSYIVALAGLVISRSRRLDLFLLAWAIVLNLCAGFNVPLPASHFGEQTGLTLSSPLHSRPRN